MRALAGLAATAMLAATAVLAVAAPAGAAVKTTVRPAPRTFVAEVWADNWFALYANGVLVGPDSVLPPGGNDVVAKYVKIPYETAAAQPLFSMNFVGK